MNARNVSSDDQVGVLRQMSDAFVALRQVVVTVITYLTLRAYGSDITWENLRDQKLPSPTGPPPQLTNAVSPGLLLSAAKDVLAASEKRRDIVVEKSKTLLTIASLLAGIVGILLPKSLRFSAVWLQILFYIAALALMNTVVMLLQMLGVRKAMFVAIDSTDASKTTPELTIGLAEAYLKVRADTDSQTDYIAEIYKGARFSFLCAFTLVWFVFTVNYFYPAQKADSGTTVNELRSDPDFLQKTKGEKGERGEKGEKGERGEKGDCDKIIIEYEDNEGDSHQANSEERKRHSVSPALANSAASSDMR